MPARRIAVAAAAAALALATPADAAEPSRTSGHILVPRNAPPPDLNEVTSPSFFENMTDAEMEAYFLAGSAVLPSQEPPYNATGTPTWDLCTGETFINAFTANSSIVKANWPAGFQHPLNNFFDRLWYGKVAYNDGTNPNVTQMWNLMFSNHTVSLTGAAYIANSSWLTNDGKPSVMLDYTDTNNIVFREMYDEMRYMANNVWLGRIWWGIPSNSFQKRSYKKFREVHDRATLALINATGVHAALWGSLVGDGSREEVTLGEGKYPLGWFAMQCAGPQAVPKLRYTGWAYWDVVRDLKNGYVTADYRLPSLNGKEGAGDKAVVGPGYPNPVNSHDGNLGRWHLYPGKLSNVEALGNFTQWQPFDKEIAIGPDDAWTHATAATQAWRAGKGAHHSGYSLTKEEVQRLEGERLIPGASLLLGKAGAKSQGANWPDRKRLPTINATQWAIEIIAQVNAAVKEAKEKPVGGWNPLARAVAEVKAEGMLAISVAADSVALVKNHIYQHVHEPMGKPNLTKAAFEDYVERVKAAKERSANKTLPKKPTDLRPNVTFDKEAFLDELKDLLTGNDSAFKAHHAKPKQGWKEKVEDLKAALMPQKEVGHSSYVKGFPGTEHLHMQRAKNPGA